MKNKRILAAVAAVCLLATVLVSALAIPVAADSRAVVTTTPTGYTEAADVVYLSFTEGNYSGVMNWGARGEDCVFLSPHAEDYYTDGYAYAVLSLLDGGTQSTAPSSDLYAALQDMMVAEHSHIISYQNTRDLYAYTDCVSNDSSRLVSFYSGALHTSVWDSGKTWNREHVWPNSKCIGDKSKDAADIMMLRPTLVKENGSRSNTAYGESSAYFDPGESVRGDCARIVLYVYVRWGNTAKMWGTSGVMENLEVLLRWMEEDPVDTWEMGRNDAVESITGVRNVFVDYPEYAWLLFDREIPDDMVTPSGMAAEGGDAPTETVPDETNPAETTPVETTPVADAPDVDDPDYEMTQPTPPPETVPETVESATESATEAESEAEDERESESEVEEVSETETAADTDADAADAVTDGEATGGGCASAAGGTAVVVMVSAVAAAWIAHFSRKKMK